MGRKEIKTKVFLSWKQAQRGWNRTSQKPGCFPSMHRLQSINLSFCDLAAQGVPEGVDVNIKQPKRWPTAGTCHLEPVPWVCVPFQQFFNCLSGIMSSPLNGFYEQADWGAGLPPWDLEERALQPRASTERTGLGLCWASERTPSLAAIRSDGDRSSQPPWKFAPVRLADLMSLNLQFPIDFVSLWCLSNTYFLSPKLAISFIF